MYRSIKAVFSLLLLQPFFQLFFLVHLLVDRGELIASKRHPGVRLYDSLFPNYHLLAWAHCPLSIGLYLVHLTVASHPENHGKDRMFLIV
jgi:hypothetical protein